MVLKGVIHIGLYVQAQPVMVSKGVKLIGVLHGDLTVCPDGLAHPSFSVALELKGERGMK